MFGGKKENQSRNFAIGLIVLLIAALAAAVYFTGNENKSKKKDFVKQAAPTEEQKIMEANKDAIKNAVNDDAGRVDKINENDHIIGQAGSPVEFIVYGDFEDPFSADYSATIKKVIETFGDKVAVAFRHFPLVTHDNAMEAAVAAECAADQGKFWEMHDKLFDDNAAEKLNSEQYLKDAEDLNLDSGKFSKCLDSGEHEKGIYEQIAAAKDAGVLGIPASFVNGQALPGAYPFDDFVDSGKYNRDGMNTIINRHLQKADK